MDCFGRDDMENNGQWDGKSNEAMGESERGHRDTTGVMARNRTAMSLFQAHKP